MANQLVRDLIAELPWAMRESVEGYVNAVQAALPDIEKDAGLRLSSEKAELFLFLVAIRRIWASVNTQYWIIHDSVSVAELRGMEGFQAGRDKFAKGSSPVAESRELRTNFDTLVDKLDIREFVIADNLSDIVHMIASEQK